MVIVGCCRQQLQLQGLQNTCCAFQLSSCNVGSMRNRRTSTSSCSDGAGVVVMSLLFRPCCIFSASACKQVRVVNIGCSSNGGGSRNSVRSRRQSSRFVCMVADEKNSQRQQQKEQQQQAQSLLVLQQHKGELLSPVEEDKDVEEEEQEEEVMTQGSLFPSSSDAIDFASSVASAAAADATAMADRRSKQRKRERTAYLFAAITSSIGFVTLAAGAVYYRFIWQMQGSGEVPYAEMLGTFSLAIGAAVGMEFWARWAHRALWHASLWNMHESHHKPREGPFELNDIFAIINAVPAITLMAFGFFNHGFVPGLCFGGGLGITMFGMAYMFVHDGLVHRRFAVGPVADFPYLQKVAAAHQLHHADLFGGIPYGLFLGPKELEEVGGQDELEKVLNLRYKIREGEREG